MDRAVLIEHRMHILQHNIDPSAEATTLPTQSPGGGDGQGEAAPSCDLTPGVDIYGHDLRGLYAERAEDCCGLCAHEPVEVRDPRGNGEVIHLVVPDYSRAAGHHA